MSERLLPDWGWRCILQARDAGWAAPGATSFIVDGVRIDILAGGAWTCAAPMLDDTARMLDLFLPWVASPAALTIGQLGQSLDGRIATEGGASHYINGLEARTHLHRLRALVDAVVVGVGTVNADDPQLTVRHVSGPNPVRVVLDPRGRADPGSKLFTDGVVATLHLVGETLAAPLPDRAAGAGHSAGRRVGLAADARGFDPGEVIALLHAAGHRRVLIEGGGVTVSRFLEAGQLDRLHLLVAPMLIGSGRPGLTLPVIDSLDAALRPQCRHFMCGGDSLFDLSFR
ncbi:MAG: RibD family protein [Thauera sp.]